MTENQIEQEEYHEIVRLIKQKNEAIETLEQKVKELQEMMKKNDENKKTDPTKILGYCAKCQLPLLAEDIVKPACPRCGHEAYRSSL